MNGSKPVNEPPPLVFKSKEAARALGICERKLWDLTDRGVVPHVRIGTSVRYPCDALRSWLATQVQGGMSTSGADASEPAGRSDVASKADDQALN